MNEKFSGMGREGRAEEINVTSMEICRPGDVNDGLE